MKYPPRFTGRYLFFKHRTPYPNPPQPTKNGIFLCCRACHTSVCLHPSALKTSRFMIAFGLPFFWFDFSLGRGKSAEYTGVCASILTMSWRKSVQKNGFVCCALYLKQRNLTKSLKKVQKCVDKLSNFYYNKSCFHEQCGGIAQLARACGSYPQCRWFKSIYRYHSGA